MKQLFVISLLLFSLISYSAANGSLFAFEEDKVLQITPPVLDNDSRKSTADDNTTSINMSTGHGKILIEQNLDTNSEKDIFQIDNFSEHIPEKKNTNTVAITAFVPDYSKLSNRTASDSMIDLENQEPSDGLTRWTRIQYDFMKNKNLDTDPSLFVPDMETQPRNINHSLDVNYITDTY